MVGSALADDVDVWVVDAARAEAAVAATCEALGLGSARPSAGTGVEQVPTGIEGQEAMTAGQTRRVVHLALRVLIARHAGTAFARRPFSRSALGRPSLEGAPFDFNLAHSGELGVIGLSYAGAVGVDVETHRAVRLSSERRRMLIEAAAGLAGDELDGTDVSDSATLRAWVRLEALAKATGEGIGGLLAKVRSAASTSRAQVVADHARVSGLVVRDVSLAPAGNAVIALACHADAPPPRVTWFPVDYDEAMKLASSKPECLHEAATLVAPATVASEPAVSSELCAEVGDGVNR
jgi:4'-phosphopantetheinyl transferase